MITTLINIILLVTIVVISILWIIDNNKKQRIIKEYRSTVELVVKMHKLSVDYIVSIYECVKNENNILYDIVQGVDGVTDLETAIQYRKSYVKDKLKSFNLGQKVFDKRFGSGFIIEMNNDYGINPDTKYWLNVCFYDNDTNKFFTKYYLEDGKYYKKDRKPRLKIHK